MIERILGAARARQSQKWYPVNEEFPGTPEALGQLLADVSMSFPEDLYRDESADPWGSQTLGTMARTILSYLEDEEPKHDSPH